MNEVHLSIADDIGARTKKSRETKADLRTAEYESWKVGYGDYITPLLETEPYRDRKKQDELVGIEIDILNQILRTLEAKKHDKDGRPVIGVDFGGMYGLSFLRIARELEKRGQLITNGKVILVVTNLQFDKVQALESLYDSNNEMSEDETEFVKSNIHLINYIQADAAELRRHVIQSNNETIPLNGNIDIIHEHAALMHGLKNDVDLPLLAKCLSNYGTLLIGSMELHLMLGTEDEIKNIKKAHNLGLENLLRLGLTQQRFENPWRYFVLRQPNAPLILHSSEQKVQKGLLSRIKHRFLG